MPVIWSLSKSRANYRPAPQPVVSCGACKFMWPRLSAGGCRYVRGVIRPTDSCDYFAPRAPGARPPS